MAVRKGTITYLDGTNDRYIEAASDSIRANREAEKNNGAIKSKDDELILYRAYLAAKRGGLKGSDKPFLDWCDTVAEVDIDLTDEMIDVLVINGNITEDQAEKMRGLVNREDDDQGESQATLA